MSSTLPKVTPVSIHAPAGGATISCSDYLTNTRFQFTLPRGERRAAPLMAGTALVFQFTLPRGERQAGNKA